MSYQTIASRARSFIDGDYSAQYRDSDELEIKTENHAHLCQILKEVSLSLGTRLSVLDLGCGTGRYFHCLNNTARLTAVDGSIEMLKQARFPVKKQQVNIEQLDLICANALDVKLRSQFDFVYSIGLFGEHAPWDLRTCNSIFNLLRPGGKLFFTVVDVFSKFSSMSMKRRLAEMVNLVLPAAAKTRLRERLETFYMSERELRRILNRSNFQDYEIHKHVSTAHIWKGAHYNCIARKKA